MFRPIDFTLFVLCTLSAHICFADANIHITQKQTPELIYKLEQYHDSGSYLKEVESKVLQAKDYLDRRLKQRKHEKFAMVLDIDETSLSNYVPLKEHHFSSNVEAFTASYLLNSLEAIGPILGLFHYAKKRGVDVFFVTSRPNTPEVLSATIRNLKQAGYEGWKGMYFQPLRDDSISTELYKQNVRKHLLDEGYTIVLNIGDQPTDLSGGFAEVGIKLPNPFYLHKRLAVG